VTLYHRQDIREFTGNQHSAVVPFREVWSELCLKQHIETITIQCLKRFYPARDSFSLSQIIVNCYKLIVIIANYVAFMVSAVFIFLLYWVISTCLISVYTTMICVFQMLQEIDFQSHSSVEL